MSVTGNPKYVERGPDDTRVRCVCPVDESSLTVLLVRCAVVVYCYRLIDEGDSWGRVAT